MDKLVEVRCPFKKKDRFTGQMHDCRRICVKVVPGSSGEAWCRDCKLAFDFSVDSQEFSKTSIRVKREDK